MAGKKLATFSGGDLGVAESAFGDVLRDHFKNMSINAGKSFDFAFKGDDGRVIKSLSQVAYVADEIEQRFGRDGLYRIASESGVPPEFIDAVLAQRDATSASKSSGAGISKARSDGRKALIQKDREVNPIPGVFGSELDRAYIWTHDNLEGKAERGRR